MARDVNLIVIHCSASPDGASLFAGEAGKPGFKTPAQTIDAWHAARGFRRTLEWRKRQNPELGSIGYHWLIYTNGAIASGRAIDEVGAHVVGSNLRSIGICMLGTGRFTLGQWQSLKALIESLELKYPGARLCGHRDLSPDLDGDKIVEPWEWLKTCPGFDVEAWKRRGMEPPAENVFQEPLKEPA